MNTASRPRLAPTRLTRRLGGPGSVEPVRSSKDPFNERHLLLAHRRWRAKLYRQTPTGGTAPLGVDAGRLLTPETTE
jgi:hypothetical protein